MSANTSEQLLSLVAQSKKNKRLESKKQKAVAFLQLVKDKQSQSPQESESGEQVMEDGQPPEKKIKREGSVTAEIGTVCTVTKPTLSGDELYELRKQLRERQKAAMGKPKVYLTLDKLVKFGLPGSSVNEEQESTDKTEDHVIPPELPPLFILDVQQLLLFALQGNIASARPRWCKLLRVGKVSSVVVVVMESVSCMEVQEYADCFPKLLSQFDTSVEMIAPVQYGSSVDEELFNVPLSITNIKNMNLPLGSSKRLLNLLVPVDKKDEPPPVADDKPDDTPTDTPASGRNSDNYSRTCLLLSSAQMIAEGCPLPVYTQGDRYKNYVFTKESYDTVTKDSPMFAVDCEMCLTVVGKNELARVSVVNEKLETIYDTLVKPRNKIRDYLTRWSGITKIMLDPVKTRIEDVQKHIQKLLPADAILCGHSICGDLTAMELFHPYLIDTSVMYNLSGIQYYKPSLRKLTAHFLGQTIQDSELGHSSDEDARATMELVLLKLQHDITFGDLCMAGLMQPVADQQINKLTPEESDNTKSDEVKGQQEDTASPQCLSLTSKNLQRRRQFFQRRGNFVRRSIFKVLKECNKTAALVDDKDLLARYQTQAVTTTETTDSDASRSKDGDQNVTTTETDSDTSRRKDGDQDITITEINSDTSGSKDVIGGQEQSIATETDSEISCKKDVISNRKHDNLTTVDADSDKCCRKAAIDLAQKQDLTWVRLKEFAALIAQTEGVTEDDKKNTLKKMDTRMHKILKNLRDNTLALVVMTGRIDDQVTRNAMTYVKIT